MTSLILSMILLGAITYLYRYSFISGPGRKIAEKIPEKFLLLLAPTAFSAIIANNMLAQHPGPEELRQKTLVAALSVVVAYFSRSVLATVLFGLGLLYILQNYPF
jgi:branched-subunit amino acid transport protein